MEEEDAFCVECGGAVSGRPCPKCGTISHRSFCPRCNAPIDELAMQALEEAQRDPRFQRACKLAQELAEIEDAIAKLDEQDENTVESLTRELDEADRALAMRYQHLCEVVKLEVSDKVDDKVDGNTDACKVETKEKKSAGPLQFSFGTCDKKKAIELYKEKVQQLNAELSSMIPDPSTPVEIQCNYLSARKMPVYTTSTIRSPQGWVCNFCGCTHSQPSECSRPELGGTWLYQESTIVTKHYE